MNPLQLMKILLKSKQQRSLLEKPHLYKFVSYLLIYLPYIERDMLCLIVHSTLILFHQLTN